ncbi:UPF0496 protein [Citrus sinensis]|uniref:UPF0496 protein n=1 Tax=Citrus sinensis TaxID=2711 RepID=A0ACB8JGY6_CITSI|nr:UPF0496 protein [Citrus sinensis]
MTYYFPGSSYLASWVYVDISNQLTDVDVREEYAHAFQIESYTFESTIAARISSYRLFAEQLLDLDQSTVIRILDLVKTPSLIYDYFTETANASLLFVSTFKVIANSLENAHSLSINYFLNVCISITHMLSNLSNPFASANLTTCRFRVVQAGCGKLLKQLESSRDEARARLQLHTTRKMGYHDREYLSSNPPYDRVSIRLVARLNDEIEHMHSMVKFWLERGETWLQASGELQLAELEEHLYLCLMTVNRARNLVMKGILDLGQSRSRDLNVM